MDRWIINKILDVEIVTSVDESTFKGRSFHRRYMPHKSIIGGVKLKTCTEKSY